MASSHFSTPCISRRLCCPPAWELHAPPSPFDKKYPVILMCCNSSTFTIHAVSSPSPPRRTTFRKALPGLRECKRSGQSRDCQKRPPLLGERDWVRANRNISLLQHTGIALFCTQLHQFFNSCDQPRIEKQKGCPSRDQALPMPSDQGVPGARLRHRNSQFFSPVLMSSHK